ncbi:ABC transporter permease [Sphingobacterium paludis]|uniref:Putative ABC transport system permease protein n=1 Tax=Sphingobacterium paludis TaxID=1476465 RepID=A0A4R7D825_9SPHI|nr:ABC transporter permease [Sphingobacterium paludis]TDS15954.1 putative ABC transport system permease protein [Sphingobacterium paludis]
MLKNYIKIAWRNLLMNKTFSVINIVGLAISLASFILIALYVTDELRYDQHHKKSDRIYRINSDLTIGGTDLHLATSSDPMGATLKAEYPEVEAFVRFYNSSGGRLLKRGDQFIHEAKIAYADSTLFDVFTIPLVAGETAHGLNKPNTVVISESAAKRYFGTADVIGKSIETNNAKEAPYKITAVFEDMPRTSHFQFDFIFSMHQVDYPWNSFLSHNFHTYVLLADGADVRSFDRNFEQIIQKHILPQARQLMDINSMEDFQRSGNKIQYTLMPLKDIHLHSDRYPELGVNGDVQYVRIFSCIAIFVLLLACVNFMNLSTARSAARAKEVGVRKVLGSKKKWLITQFLTESMLMVWMAFLLAIGLSALFLHYFNTIAGKELAFADLFSPAFLLLLLLFTLVVGGLAGIYPALVLSRFKPISVLKGKIDGGFRRSKFRSGLVVFQFLTSVALAAGTMIIYQQLNFIQHKKIGFDKDHVLIVKGTQALGANAESFRHSISQLPDVQSSSFARFLPVANSDRNDNAFSKDPVMNESNSFNAQRWDIDYDYIPTLGMEISQGRNFSRQYGSDSTGMLINESAAKVLGYANPVGQKIYMPYGDGESMAYTVVGVVKNFHFESLRQHVGPLVMRLGNNRSAAAFRVSSTDLKQFIGNVEQEWKARSPALPFSYHFLDESFDAMYKVEQRVGKLAISFSILAVFIACLGLFGLTTFIVEQRVKEIGIRKVLGASISGILVMISKDFVRLVLIAVVIGTPLTWWAMSKWLEDFAYRIDIKWWMFALAGFLSIMVALMTISYQAIRAAKANPVNSLRDE